jgi:hypothetical protein
VSFKLTWKGGTQTVATRADAVVLARSMEGVVLLSEDPSGSVITFRDGRELAGEEATQATLDFMDRGNPMREALLRPSRLRPCADAPRVGMGRYR